jgi:hypothetical protein
MTSPDAADKPAVSSTGAPAAAETAPDAPAPAGPGTAPGASTSSGPKADAAARTAVAPVGEPVLPEQSPEDTDAAWGEYREPDDDRLYRDRPPHWADY